MRYGHRLSVTGQTKHRNFSVLAESFIHNSLPLIQGDGRRFPLQQQSEAVPLDDTINISEAYAAGETSAENLNFRTFHDVETTALFAIVAYWVVAIS